jgi:hypothetical protein
VRRWDFQTVDPLTLYATLSFGDEPLRKKPQPG